MQTATPAKSIKESAMHRWFGGLLALVLTVVWGLLAYEIAHIRNGRLEASREAAVNLAYSLAAHTRTTFEAVDSQLKIIDETQVPFSDYPPLSPEATAEIAEHVKSMSAIYSAHVFSADGTTLQGAMPGQQGHLITPTKKLNVADRDYFKFFSEKSDHIIPADLYIGKPVQGRLTKEWFLPVSRARRDDHGGFAGIVLATINLKAFNQLYAGFKLEPDHTIGLSRTDGIFLARAPFDASLLGKSFGDTPLFRRHLVRASAGTFDSADGPGGAPRIISFKRLDDLPLVVTVERTRASVLGNWWNEAAVLALAGTIATLFLAYFTKSLWFQTRILADRSDVLEAAIEARTRELTASEQRYRQLFEGNKAVELIIDPTDGSIVDANHAAEAFYGHSRAALTAMAISDINTLSPDEVRAEMERARYERRSHFFFRHRLASGEIRDVEVHSGPIDVEGRPLLYSIIHDITDRCEAEEHLRRTLDELIRTNNELERFADAASHDLQEPVRAVSTYAQLLDKRYGDRLDEDGREYLDYLVADSKRMSALVRDLAAFSRVSAQAAPFQPVDMGHALDVARLNLKDVLGQSDAEITAGPLPIVRGDESQLIDLLQRLIGNAVKFRRSQEPPKIRIQAKRIEEERWEFTITDNGIGIETDYLEQIFVIFKRLHSIESYPGTGIGLAVCRRIVERHGGSIWAVSEPGQGSVFHFTLPAATRSLCSDDERP